MQDRLPTLFLSHGSPMYAIEPGDAGGAWAELGRTLPKPRAVLMVSAHWETAVPMLSGSTKPETIHDFGGFPPELVSHRLSGAWRARARDAMRGAAEGRRHHRRCRRLPRARSWRLGAAALDVSGGGRPRRAVVGAARVGPAHHVQLGRALAPLAGDGVLIIGSGHTTHNLRDWMANARRPDPLKYAQAFSAWLAAALAAHDTDALVGYRERAPEAERAHPSDEHFLPLFVAYGAAGDRPRPERFIDGFLNGALAMDSYLFHAEEALAHA